MDKKVYPILTLLNEAPRSIIPGSDAVIMILAGSTRIREHLILSGGLLLSHIKNVTIKTNGNQRRHLGSGAWIDLMNQHNGLESFANSGVLTISHIREGLRKFKETHATAVGMANSPDIVNAIGSMEIRITLDASAPATSHIESYGDVTVPLPPGVVMNEVIHSFDVQTDGEKTISNLFERHEKVNAIFLEYENCAIDRLIVNNNRREIFNRPKAVNDHILKSGGYKIPQAGYFALDKTERGFGEEIISVNRTSFFELKPTFSSVVADAKVHVHVQTIENLSPIAA